MKKRRQELQKEVERDNIQRKRAIEERLNGRETRQEKKETKNRERKGGQVERWREDKNEREKKARIDEIGGKRQDTKEE